MNEVDTGQLRMLSGVCAIVPGANTWTDALLRAREVDVLRLRVLALEDHLQRTS
jgi:hypothetical protein